MTVNNTTPLTKLGIRVWNGMPVYWPQTQQTEFLKIGRNDPMTYAGNNGVIIWTNESGESYVGVYTRQLISLLKEAGFASVGSSQYVPFSNWDYPLGMKDKWEQLWERAQAQRELEFKEDCVHFCDEHGIRELPDEFMARCFRIPRTGLEVQYFWGEKSHQKAAVDAASFDCTVPDMLGRCDSNNGRTSFVYRDGTQYVLKGYWIKQLEAAGYNARKGLFVPFSNGETPADASLRSLWENLPEQKVS